MNKNTVRIFKTFIWVKNVVCRTICLMRLFLWFICKIGRQYYFIHGYYGEDDLLFFGAPSTVLSICIN